MTNTGSPSRPFFLFLILKYSQDNVVFCFVVTLFSAKRTLHIPFLSSIVVVVCIVAVFVQPLF